MVLIPIISKNIDAKTVERYLPLLHKRCLPIPKHLLIHGLLFFACELNGLSLEQDSVATGFPMTTCSYMRHKLFKAISKVNDNVILHGLIELDSVYTKINLKGTRPQNMHRSSKHEEGRKNARIQSRHLRE